MAEKQRMTLGGRKGQGSVTARKPKDLSVMSCRLWLEECFCEVLGFKDNNLSIFLNSDPKSTSNVAIQNFLMNLIYKAIFH